MLPKNQSYAARASSNTVSRTEGQDETGRFLSAAQSFEEMTSREISVPAEGVASGSMAFTALLPQDTQEKLARFLRRFEEGATAPRHVYEAVPLVELWHNSLSREIPRGNPIRKRCKQIIDGLNQQFNNVSARVLSAATYMHVDSFACNDANLFNPTNFLTEMMGAFVQQMEATSVDNALENESNIFINDASVKAFIYVTAKYHAEISDDVKAKASKFIEKMSKTRFMLMENMLDEARLIFGAEYEPALMGLAPTLEKLVNIYQYQPSGDVVG